MGDPERLQQVFWNLLSNAIKFTPKNGRVRVGVECVGSSVEVVVSDTGVGIDPVFLPHVFDRFTQEDSSSTRSARGLGLGLVHRAAARRTARRQHPGREPRGWPGLHVHGKVPPFPVAAEPANGRVYSQADRRSAWRTPPTSRASGCWSWKTTTMRGG